MAGEGWFPSDSEEMRSKAWLNITTAMSQISSVRFLLGAVSGCSVLATSGP